MKVLFLLPGHTFSDKYVHAWTETLMYCARNGIEFQWAFFYNPIIHVTRNGLLGGSPKHGTDQRPFQGTVEYDYIMWIDDDMVWNPEDIVRLLSHELDIVAGCYMMTDQRRIVAVEHCDTEYALKHDSFQFLTMDDINGRTAPFEVDHAGMGFMLVKRGVYEKIKFPWFEAAELDLGTYKAVAGEDVSFCHKAQAAGFKIHLDPMVRVGHQKSLIIVPR